MLRKLCESRQPPALPPSSSIWGFLQPAEGLMPTGGGGRVKISLPPPCPQTSPSAPGADPSDPRSKCRLFSLVAAQPRPGRPTRDPRRPSAPHVPEKAAAASRAGGTRFPSLLPPFPRLTFPLSATPNRWPCRMTIGEVQVEWTKVPLKMCASGAGRGGSMARVSWRDGRRRPAGRKAGRGEGAARR